MNAAVRRAGFGRQQVIVLAAAAASFGLLNWQLGVRSLWNDEYLSQVINEGDFAHVMAEATADIHPVLYPVLRFVWTHLTGNSDFSQRWPSIVFALLTVPLVAVLGRRLFGAATGTLAAVGLAFSPALVEFGRMARYYSMLPALALLATLCLLSALRRPGWRWWAAYAVAGALLLYTFYPLAVVLLIHAGIVLFWPDPRRRLLRRWFVASIVTGLVFLPMFIIAAAQRVAAVAGASGADLSRTGVGLVLGLAAAGYTFGVGETIFPWNPVAVVGLLIVAALLIAALWRSHDRRVWLCAGGLIVSVVAMAVITTFVSVSTPFLNVPVRALFALPAFVLILAVGLARLPGRWVGPALGVVLLGVWIISIANDFAGQQFLNPIYLTPAKEAAAQVNEQAVGTDLVISDYDSIVNNYLPPTLPDGQPGPARVTTQDRTAITAGLAQQPPRVWLVTLGRDATAAGADAPAVRQQLLADYVLVNSDGLLPIDPTYRHAKELILRRPTYAYRLTIELYRRAH